MTDRTRPEPLPRSVRRRARAEITREIVDVARRQLATEGAAALSLRAVARELGMVSSAVYRYVASRDDLLTLLILDGYNALGQAVEAAEAEVPRGDLFGRWMTICHGVRDWALAHPHEYSLLYGSPVPGYEAPPTTVPAASRVTALLSLLLQDLSTLPQDLSTLRQDLSTLRQNLSTLAPEVSPAVQDVVGIRPDLAQAVRPVRPFVPDAVPDELLIRGLAAWTGLFGAVSFELFGHWNHVIDDDPALRRAFFTEQMARSAQVVGIRRAVGRA